MNDFKEKMKERTLRIAIKILNECNQLPASAVNVVLIKQLTRSITSVGANYREACRAKSRADFISKLQIVEAECDESIYWIALLGSQENTYKVTAESNLKELNEILSIVVKAIRTARGVV